MRVFTHKVLNERKDRLFWGIVSMALAVYIAFSCTYFCASAETVKKDVVRLHILANSDCEADQQVKLKVRDALLSKNTLILSEGVTAENAVLYFEKSKEELLETAKEVLKENGYDYNVTISLEKEYFETREYGELTFPAGEYTALKVVLGEGKGKNWWCVMFPPLCVPAADGVEADKEKTADYLTPGGEKIVNGGDKYIVRFKLLEIFEKLKDFK